VVGAMSFESDNQDFEDKNLMVQREILDYLKMIVLILEEVHGTGIRKWHD
jgi:hypothetical protein